MTISSRLSLTDLMSLQLSKSGTLPFLREHRFAPPRKWRFDYAWPEMKVALEIEGGTWVNGRHIRALGFERDCEKYNTAAIKGWKLIRVTGDMVKDGRAITFIEKALGLGEK